MESGRLSPSRAVGAAGARLPDTEKVTGSNPVTGLQGGLHVSVEALFTFGPWVIFASGSDIPGVLAVLAVPCVACLAGCLVSWVPVPGHACAAGRACSWW